MTAPRGALDAVGRDTGRETACWRSAAALGSLMPMARSFAAVAAALVCLVLVCLVPGLARAHPTVDEARRAYESAQHARSLELLEEAEAGTGLTREDLAELLLLRAMVHRAQRQMDLAEVDLLRLANLDPQRQLGRTVHPTLRRLFETVRERVPGPVRLEVAADRMGGMVRLRVSVNDDVAALTQAFRLYGRPAGGAWRDTDASTLEVSVRPSQAVEYYAEAIGPGGAVIANHGTRGEPSRLPAEGGAVDTGTEPDPIIGTPDPGHGSRTPTTPPPGEDVPAWPFVVGGIVLAVGAAVLIGVLVAQPTDETQLTRPGVESLVSAPYPLLTFD